jgi:serine phosphatase RsbU (regulator of sigma subunit)/anti-sigma regulatory factor (Ser/Thr protein kinase)
MTAPLVVRGHVLGVLHVGFRTPRLPSEDDRNLFSTLARQCSQALDRARLYESEHRAAETLQLSLLPGRLPEVDGVRLAARYLPAGAGAQVGGDWYDAIRVDGWLGLVVGDVEGRGIAAASKMGQLRTALRAYALKETHPGVVLESLNRFVHGLGSPHFATIACIVLDPATGEIRMANAGHPPPLVVDPDGRARYLDVPLSPPIGAVADARYPERSEHLVAGATLVLYTDGLVERRSVTLTDGLRRLQDVARRSLGEPRTMLDRVLEELAGGDRGDDVALLAVARSTRPTALVRHLQTDPHVLAALRRDIRWWLRGAGASEEEIQAVVVASGEAVTNALEHPIEPSDDVIDLRGEVGEGVVSLVVRDRGTWREPVERRDRGRGLLLMRAFMDSVEVVPGAPGTEVRMRRRLSEDAMARDRA